MSTQHVYLCGDEDGGATLWCWTCGTDSDAIAYYSGFCNLNPYPTDVVPSVDNIQGLAALAAQHVATHEPDTALPETMFRTATFDDSGDEDLTPVKSWRYIEDSSDW